MKNENTFWRRVLRAWLVPRRGGRVRVTSAGAGLLAFIGVSGAGAYALGSNALFISFAVLVSVLALSFAMAWLNLRGVRCRLCAAPSMRAGTEELASVEIFGARRPFGARAVCAGVRRRGGVVERVWAGNVERGETARATWSLRAERRGVERLEVVEIGSLFPFGFFEKTVRVSAGENDAAREVLVRPAAVKYRWLDGFGAAAERGARMARAARSGAESAELLALREYREGDAQRRIHWRASARAGRLLVREFVAEENAGVILWVRTDAGLWRGARDGDTQFEKMCSFAAALAEDLFAAGELAALAVDGQWRRAVRSRADVEAFLDALAALSAGHAAGAPRPFSPRSRILTFAPGGTEGVVAYVDGTAAASA